jgi:hypothetical protein
VTSLGRRTRGGGRAGRAGMREQEGGQDRKKAACASGAQRSASTCTRGVRCAPDRRLDVAPEGEHARGSEGAGGGCVTLVACITWLQAHTGVRTTCVPNAGEERERRGGVGVKARSLQQRQRPRPARHPNPPHPRPRGIHWRRTVLASRHTRRVQLVFPVYSRCTTPRGVCRGREGGGAAGCRRGCSAQSALPVHARSVAGGRRSNGPLDAAHPPGGPR